MTHPFRFWIYWTLIIMPVIPVINLISLIPVLLIHDAFGFNMKEWGTPLSQTLMQMAAGIVIGLGTGCTQWLLLKRRIPLSPSWIYLASAGFAAGELIIGILFWQMGLNRAEQRFIEGNALMDSIIFAFLGLTIGLFQLPLLRRNFHRTLYWPLASMLGWCICILPFTLMEFSPAFQQNASFGGLLLLFCFGSLLYGAVTGATLCWLVKPRENLKE